MSQDLSAAALEFTHAEEQAKRRRQQLLSLFRGRLHWAILLAGLLGLAGAVAGYFSQKAMYSSVGVAIVQPRVASIESTAMTEVPVYFQAFISNEVKAITDANTLQRAMENQNWKDALLGAGLPPMGFGDFKSGVEAVPPKGTNYDITVMYTHEVPEVAEAGLNAVLSAYRDTFRNRVSVESEGTIADYDSTIRQLKLDLEALRRKRNSIVPEAEAVTLGDRISSKNADLLRIESQLGEVRNLLNFYGGTASQPQQPGETALHDTITDPRVIEFTNEITRLEGMIDTLKLQGRGENHRDVKNLRAQVNTFKSQRQQMIDQIRNGGDGTIQSDNTEVLALRRSEATLSAQARDLSAELNELKTKLTGIVDIDRDITELQKRMSGYEGARFDEILASNAAAGRIEVRGGVVPSAPSNAGKRVQLAIMGGGAGAGLGVGLIMLVGLLDSRLRHAIDVKHGLPHTRMLGVLPSLPDSLTDPEQAERAAHAVNHVRTLLQISGPANRVFSITGPAAGSGKSSLTVAMGLSFAATGNKVLLIDGDIVGAGLTRRLGAVVNKPFEEVVRADGRVSGAKLAEAEKLAMTRGINLADALIEMGALSREEADKLARRRSDATLGILDVCNGTAIEQCVAATGVPRLHVLPVGNARPEDAGLLSPQSLRTLLTAAREAYDMVIVDTGPVLGSLEASMAAAEADCTVLIVSRGDSKAVAARSLEHLVSVGARVAGVVFNHALDSDLAEASYGSLVAQDRRLTSTVQVDPAAAARFGPLGSAVASYGPAAALRENSNGSAPAPGSSAANGRRARVA